MKNTLSADLMKCLHETDTTAIFDAIETFNVRPRTEGFMSSEIRCLFPELGVMVGYAVTVCFDNSTVGVPYDVNQAVRLWEAIQASPKPAVVVCKDIADNPIRSAHFGEGMTTMSEILGAVGMVSDACVRDVEGIHTHRFHVFCRGTIVSHGAVRIVAVGQPVTIGGLTITPGDLIHANGDGVLLIPDVLVPRMDEVLFKARAISEREQELWRYYRSPEFTIEGWRKLH